MTKRNRSLARRILLRRATRFVFLSCVFSILIGLMAFAEALVLWFGGANLGNKSLPQKISITDFSISANGEWGVSRVCFLGKARRGLVHDVVVHNLRGQNAVRLHVSRYRPRCVAVSPISDVVAIACWDGSIRAWSGSPDCEAGLSASDVRLRLLDRVSDFPNCLEFSPDGRLLAVVGKRFAYVWRWPGGELLQKRPHEAGKLPFLSFSGNSRHVVSPGRKGEVCLWDAYTGQTIKAIKAILPVADAAVSPDARLVAFADTFQKVRVYSLVADEELWCQSNCGGSIAFSPDGSFLVTDCYTVGNGVHWRLNVYDACSGQRMCELPGHRAPLPGLVFASDGLLYSYGPYGVIRAWNIEHQREQWCFSTLAWASSNRFFLEVPEQLDACKGRNDGR